MDHRWPLFLRMCEYMCRYSGGVRHFTPLVLLIGLTVTDLLCKAWAATALPGVPPQPLLPGLLGLQFTLNPGMAWGLLGDLTVGLALLRLAAGLTIMIVLATRRLPQRRALALALIGAGALSNALDGLTRGAVVDYLHSPALDNLHRHLTGQPFPIFNGADVLVLAGALLLTFLTSRPTRAALAHGDPP